MYLCIGIRKVYKHITIGGRTNRGIDMDAMDRAIEELRGIEGVNGVLVVSTSGAHIYGEAPPNAHLETFTTMSAILLGAAQTATKELRDKLRDVEVDLEGSKLLIHPAGPRALLVLNVEKGREVKAILKKSAEVGEHIGKLL